MAMKDLGPGLEKLGSGLDDLEETLQPLVDNLRGMSSELPLLDKAKLMTLTAYSIESLLFCKNVLSSRLRQHSTDPIIAALRLQGVDTSNHEVMNELKRVKQYFAKIKEAEEGPSQRSTTVNTEAATRMLKADLVSIPVLTYSGSRPAR